jgi:NADP-dependent 3-hydroxy acid dehydrogenase YdfG
MVPQYDDDGTHPPERTAVTTTAGDSDRPVALVTGATGGIGRIIAARLAESHDVVLLGRNTASLRDLQEEIPGSEIVVAELDRGGIVPGRIPGIDRLDVLVHCAGVFTASDVADASRDAWRAIFEVNVFSVVELTAALLPALRANRGTVVCINSGGGLISYPGISEYAASKFALTAFADSLRAEEAANGVRVSSIHPGDVDTGMQRVVSAALGTPHTPAAYLPPHTVADAVRLVVDMPKGASVETLVLKPY